MPLNVSGREELLIPSIFSFYSNKQYLQIFIHIVVEEESISLRLFDYFATNYSKQHKVHVDKTGTDIYTAYKQNLKGYKKEYFDPFCRRKRIAIKGKNFNISKLSETDKNKKLIFSFTELANNDPNELTKKNNNDKDIIITTIGQLNFFKWCIESNIIAYIFTNSKKIEQSMSAKKPKSDKKMTVVKKDKNKNNNNNVYKTRMNFTLKFTNNK